MDLPLICDWPNRPKQKVCYETGKPAQTEYEVVEYAADNTARVVLKPITGRSEIQLRVHMLALGILFSAIVFMHHQKRERWHRVCCYMQRC